MIVGRRAFSTDEVNRLMLGRYVPAKVPEIGFMESKWILCSDKTN